MSAGHRDDMFSILTFSSHLSLALSCPFQTASPWHVVAIKARTLAIRFHEIRCEIVQQITVGRGRCRYPQRMPTRQTFELSLCDGLCLAEERYAQDAVASGLAAIEHEPQLMSVIMLKVLHFELAASIRTLDTADSPSSALS